MLRRGDWITYRYTDHPPYRGYSWYKIDNNTIVETDGFTFKVVKSATIYGFVTELAILQQKQVTCKVTYKECETDREGVREWRALLESESQSPHIIQEGTVLEVL